MLNIYVEYSTEFYSRLTDFDDQHMTKYLGVQQNCCACTIPPGFDMHQHDSDKIREVIISRSWILLPPYRT